MPYTVTTPPSIEPVTTSELKSYLRVTGTSEDTLLGTLISTARQQVESLTRRPLITQSLAATFADFPEDFILRLPVGNVASITNIKYYDALNALSAAITNTNYFLITADQPASVRFIDTYDFPEVYDRSDAVVVTVSAGYGATAGSVPESLRVAVMMLAAYWFEQRLPVNVGNLVNPMPMHVKSIINRYRVITPEI